MMLLLAGSLLLPVPGALAQKGSDTKTPAKNQAKSPNNSPKPRKKLRERISIVYPRFNHPRVSEHTLYIVRTTIENLPAHIYQILDEGGAAVFVGTNPLDKFPDSLKVVHPADGHLFCNEPGRTYKREMYIWERALAEPGYPDVGGVRTDADIKLATLMQCAHALDDCLENLSREKAYLTLYKQDIASMSPQLRSELSLYVADRPDSPMEAFGEILMLLTGARTPLSDKIKAGFPRARMWVDSTIKAIKPANSR